MNRHYRNFMTTLFAVFMALAVISGCKWGTDPNDGAFTLDFNPSPAIIDGVGETVDVDVMANNADGLITARMTISFKSSMVSVESLTVKGSDFLFEESGAAIDVLEAGFNNDSGTIVIAVGAVKSEFTGAKGSGKLATITFRGLSEGSGFLSFIDYEQTDTLMAEYTNRNSSGWDTKTLSQHLGIIRVQVEPPSVSPSEPTEEETSGGDSTGPPPVE